MKHLKDQEVSQFRLDYEKQTRCRFDDSKLNTCGSCQSCLFINKLHDTKQWLVQAGGPLKLKFLAGVLIRCQSVDILKNTLKIIQVTLGKDFTYARSRLKPNVSCELISWNHNKMTNRRWFEAKVLETWNWFSSSKYWVKANFLLGLVSLCEIELLQALGNLIRVLIEREKKAFMQQDSVLNNLEDSSPIPESHFSLANRPELQLLFNTRSTSAVVDLPRDVHELDMTEIPVEIPSNLAHSKDQLEEPHCAGADESDFGGGGTQNREGSSGDKTLYPEEPALTVVPGTYTSLSGVSRHRDFIRSLPVHLAKRILGLLDRTTLLSCCNVSQHWRFLAEEVQEDNEAKRIVENQAMIMQGSSKPRANTMYSKIQEVLVPTAEKREVASPETRRDKGFESAYSGCTTKSVEMEEKNMFCGAYNVLMLSNREDSSRVVHYNGGQLAAVGSRDRLVRLLDVWAMKERSLIMQGHAGSIKAVYLCEDRGLVISTGYDLTIRCWDLRTGNCKMLFRGHFGTINCLDLHENTLVSGAKDCRVKVWSLRTGRCQQRLRFRHDGPVQCVRVGQSLVLSSCDRGQLKLWNTDTGGLLKQIESQQGAVRCLHLDEWHVLSGGEDGYVMAWSTSSEHPTSLMSYRHPREVLSLSFLFLRVITGCADGKIRIFDFLTGSCLRVIISNSQQCPVLSMHIHDNNILVNTRASVIIFQFEKEDCERSGHAEGESQDQPERDPPRSRPRSPSPETLSLAQMSSSSGVLLSEGKQAEKDSLSHHAPSLATPSLQREKSAGQRPLSPAAAHHCLAHSSLQQDLNAKPPPAPCFEMGIRVQDLNAKPPTAPCSEMGIRVQDLNAKPPTAPCSEMGIRVQDLNPKPPTAPCSEMGIRRARQRPKSATCSLGREPVVPVNLGCSHGDEVKKMGLCHLPAHKHTPSEAKLSQRPRRCKRPGCKIHPDGGVGDVVGASTFQIQSQLLVKGLLPGATKLTSPAQRPASTLPCRPLPCCHVRPFTASPSLGTRSQKVEGSGNPLPHPHPRPGVETTGSKQVEVSQGVGSGKAVNKIGAITTTAVRDVDPEQGLPMDSPEIRPGRRMGPGRHVGFTMTSDPVKSQVQTFDPFRRSSLFCLLTPGQLEEREREAVRKHQEVCARERCREEKKRRRAWLMMAKGISSAPYWREGQIHAPELGANTYI